MLKEFKAFVARGNLVERAVAFILGVAFAAVVTAFTQVVLSLERPDEEAGPTEIDLLTEIRDELARR
jgi:large-conductance mechanosensitive channel